MKSHSFWCMGLLAASGALSASEVTVLRQQAFGGQGEEWLYSVVPASDGGLLLGGSSSSAVGDSRTATNWGSADFWALKIDAAGNQLWDASYGGSRGDSLRAILPTADGGFLLGGNSWSDADGSKTAAWRGRVGSYDSPDYWVVKIDELGNQQWDASFGGSCSDSLEAVLLVPAGGYLLAGSSYSETDGNKTSRNQSYPAYDTSAVDFWAVRVSDNGAMVWDMTYGGGAADTLLCAAATPDGCFLLGGRSSSGPDSGWNASRARMAAWRGGASDAWLVKIDAQGNKLWDQSYGGTGNEGIYCIVPAGDGGCLLGGYSDSPASGNKSAPNWGWDDGWVLKIDAAGNLLWDRSHGGISQDRVMRLASAGDGGWFAAGESMSPPSGNKGAPHWGDMDVWLLKINSEGFLQWDQSHGGTDEEGNPRLLPGEAGSVWLAGYSKSAADGNKTVASFGERDFWLLTLAQPATAPTIIAPPQSVVAASGQRVVFTVEAFGGGAPLRYQWRRNGMDLPGATNETLTLSSVQASDAGTYAVLVSNDLGAVASQPAVLTYTEAPRLMLGMYPALTIFGDVGMNYRVEHSQDAAEPMRWTPLTNLVLTGPSLIWADTTQPATNRRFYRVLVQQ